MKSVNEALVKSSTVLMLAAVTLTLAACNRPDTNRTPSTPGGMINPTTLMEPPVTLSAPAAPAERGPIPPNANDAAPGTDASIAFAGTQARAQAKLPPSKGGAPDAQARQVEAQDAAAKAPDTASADAAKVAVLNGRPAS